MSVASGPGLLAPASIRVAFGAVCLATAVECAASKAERLSPLAVKAEIAKTAATFLRISLMSFLSKADHHFLCSPRPRPVVNTSAEMSIQWMGLYVTPRHECAVADVVVVGLVAWTPTLA